MTEEKVGKVMSLEELKYAYHPAWPYMEYEKWGNDISDKKSLALLKGCIDMHCHSAPEGWIPFRPSAVDTCIEASRVGMKALVFKDHNTLTSDRAFIIEECLEKMSEQEEGFTPVQVYGSLTLNYSVGGLNPEAVKPALTADFGRYTKIVYMPSLHAEWQYKCMGRDGGMRILDEKGKLKSEVKEIIQLVAEAPTKVCLGTCHISVEEALVLAEEGQKAGVDVIATHASQELTLLTVEEAKELINRGAWIELCQCSILGTPVVGGGMGINFHHSIKLMKELGPSRMIIGTDAGQPGNYTVPAYRSMIRAIMLYGISEEAVHIMARSNPEKLLGID